MFYNSAGARLELKDNATAVVPLGEGYALMVFSESASSSTVSTSGCCGPSNGAPQQKYTYLADAQGGALYFVSASQPVLRYDNTTGAPAYINPREILFGSLNLAESFVDAAGNFYTRLDSNLYGYMPPELALEGDDDPNYRLIKINPVTKSRTLLTAKAQYVSRIYGVSEQGDVTYEYASKKELVYSYWCVSRERQ